MNTIVSFLTRRLPLLQSLKWGHHTFSPSFYDNSTKDLQWHHSGFTGASGGLQAARAMGTLYTLYVVLLSGCLYILAAIDTNSNFLVWGPIYLFMNLKSPCHTIIVYAYVFLTCYRYHCITVSSGLEARPHYLKP